MAAHEPTPLVDESEEAPDVLDVRVREREVVVPPVHPHPEPLRLLGDRLGRPGHLLAAAASELGEPVLLDLPLRVEAELALDADLDPQPLAVVAVLVPLAEAAHRLVPLKDVLERPTPHVMDAHALVGGDRAVDEAPLRAARVLFTQLLEDAVRLPERENLELQTGVVGNGWKSLEHGKSV